MRLIMTLCAVNGDSLNGNSLIRHLVSHSCAGVQGCQGAVTGVSWSGRLSAQNSPRTSLVGATVDAGRPEELRFDELHADRPEAPLSIDGVLRFTPGLLGRLTIHNGLTIGGAERVRLAVDARSSVSAASTSRRR